MTDRLYYTDPSLLEFEAKIISTEKQADNRYATVLDRSAFYPTSGGQSHDLGQLGKVAIVDVLEDKTGEVIHITASCPGQFNEMISGKVDYERRKKHCQLHTGQHLLSQAFFRLINGTTMSVHLGEEYGAIEFDKDSITEETLLKAEQLVNQMVAECVPIEIIFADSSEIENLGLRRQPAREGRLRIIKMGDLEVTACGGTHCTNTGQVQLIKLIGSEPIRKRTMVKFLAGAQAFADYNDRYNISTQLTRTLTCGLSDLPEKLNKLTEEIKALKQNLTASQKQLLPVIVEELLNNVKSLGSAKALFSVITDDKVELGQQLSINCADKINGLAVLVAGERIFIACAKDSGLTAGGLMKALTSKTTVKGGGNNIIAQGAKAKPDQLALYQQIISEALA